MGRRSKYPPKLRERAVRRANEILKATSVFPPVSSTASGRYTEHLVRAGIASNRGRTGTALDNAMAESVISTVKTWPTKRRTWRTC